MPFSSAAAHPTVTVDGMTDLTSPERTSGPRVCLAVGKPPRPGTVVAEVVQRLQSAGAQVEVRLPHEDPRALDAVGAPDLLVHRGLRPATLADVAALERAGVPCCNPAAACAVVADRAAVVRALQRAGLPAPATSTWTRWSDVQAQAAAGPLVVKSATDPEGRSARVALLLAADAPEPFRGPWLSQAAVVGDGLDRKLYVAGRQVDGLLKPALFGNRRGAPAEPFEPSAKLVELAHAVADALGLHLLGVDVLVGPTGPSVVDVNVFPGFRGVSGGARSVATHLLSHLTGDPRGAVAG